MTLIRRQAWGKHAVSTSKIDVGETDGKGPNGGGNITRRRGLSPDLNAFLECTEVGQ